MAAHKVELPNLTGPWSEEKAVEAIKRIPAAASWDTDKVLRFGECVNVKELLIPAQMLGLPQTKLGGGPLDMKTRCFRTLNAMEKAMRNEDYGNDLPVVDYTAFRPVSKRELSLSAREKGDCQMV